MRRLTFPERMVRVIDFNLHKRRSDKGSMRLTRSPEQTLYPPPLLFLCCLGAGEASQRGGWRRRRSPPRQITCCFSCLLAHLMKQYKLTDHFAGHLGDGAAGSIMRFSHFDNKADGGSQVPATFSCWFWSATETTHAYKLSTDHLACGRRCPAAHSSAQQRVLDVINRRSWPPPFH